MNHGLAHPTPWTTRGCFSSLLADYLMHIYAATQPEKSFSAEMVPRAYTTRSTYVTSIFVEEASMNMMLLEQKKSMNMRHQHARIVLLLHRVNLYPSLQVEYSSHHYSQAECKIETKLAEDHVMSSNNIARPDVQDKTISKAHHVPTGTCINRMRFGTAQDMSTQKHVRNNVPTDLHTDLAYRFHGHSVF